MLEVESDALIAGALGESSHDVKARVITARDIQIKRQGKINAELQGKEIDQFCILGDNERLLLANAIEKLGLSARAYHRIVKIARTIADLAAQEMIARPHIQEAISYRKFERFQQ